MTTMTRAARNQTVIENQSLIHHFVKPYRGRGIPDEDLYGAGLIGLIEAVDTHDPSKGALSTHAAFRIRKRINELLEAQAEDALTFRRSLHELEDVHPQPATEPENPTVKARLREQLAVLPDVLREALLSEHGALGRPRTTSREEAARVRCSPTTVSYRRRAALAYFRPAATDQPEGALA